MHVGSRAAMESKAIGTMFSVQHVLLLLLLLLWMPSSCRHTTWILRQGGWAIGIIHKCSSVVLI